MSPDKLFGPENCLRPEAMQDYLYGGLTPQEMQRAERHMLDCAFCAEAMEGLELSKDASRHIAALNERISAAGAGSRHQQRTYLRYAAAIAVVAAISVVLFGVVKKTTEPDNTLLSDNTAAELPEAAEVAKSEAEALETPVENGSPADIVQGDEEPVAKAAGDRSRQANPQEPPIQFYSAADEAKEVEAVAPAGAQDEDIPAPAAEQQAAAASPPAATPGAKEGRAEDVPAGTAKRAKSRGDDRNRDALTVPEGKSVQEGEVTKREAEDDRDFEELSATQSDSIEEQIFVIVEVMPAFPGGERAMMEYLQKNLRYPDSAMTAGIQGTVYVSFIVRKDGRIDDIRVLRGANELLNAEAVRVIRAMPRWEPGKQRGKAVNVQYALPIRFILKE